MRKRVFSIFLAILVFFSMPVNVYATGADHGGGGSHHLTDEEKALAKLDFIKNFERDFQYILCQLGALSTSNYKQLYTNFLDGLDMKLDDYLDQEVSVDDDGEVVLSSDLIASIKQALKEYQKENDGFEIVPTLGIGDLSPAYTDGILFRTLSNLVNKYGIVGVRSVAGGKNFNVFFDLSPYLESSAGFYRTSSLGSLYPAGSFGSFLADFVTWQPVPLDSYYVYGSLDSPLKSWEDLQALSGDKVTFTEDYMSTNNNGVYFCFDPSASGFYRYYMTWSFVVTPSGSDVLVFNSLEALKNYSINKRIVFTTEKFYEDTGDLTLSVDRMNETLKDMNGLLDQFRDSLPSDENLTEDQLEKLLGAFLDEFFARYEQSGGGGSGSGGTDTGGGSGSGGTDVSGILGFLESILQALEEGFSGILMYLDEGFSALSAQLADIAAGVGSIDESLEGMTQEQVKEGTDSFLSTVSLLQSKFPFSVPWDLYDFLAVLAGRTVEVRGPGGTDVAVCAYAAGVPAPVLSAPGSDTGGGGSSGGVSLPAYSADGAPVFRIPFEIASAGIHEEIEIDMAPFGFVHTVCRSMLTVMYCIGLMQMTFKVVDLGRGLLLKDD